MNGNKRHIRISLDNDSIIRANIKNNKKTYTEEINDILRKGISSDEILLNTNSLNKKIENSIRLLNLSFALLKQIYSDLDFPEVTDPNKSNQLKTFFVNMKKDRFDD